MTGYDQAQSPRLGQRVPYEGTTVRQFTGEELPEVSVDGQIIFRKDTEILQVYSEEDNAWQDVSGGVAGTLTYVGDTKPPTPPAKADDIWYDTTNNHRLNVHDGTDFQPVFVELGDLDPEVTAEMQAQADAAEAAATAVANTKTDVTTLPADLTNANMVTVDPDTGEEEVATITAANFQTSSEPSQGIKIDGDGLRAYGPAGGAPFMDVKPAEGLVIVAGEGTFDKLKTTGEVAAGEASAELSGRTDITTGSEINLNSGTLPPGTAPPVGYSYETYQFTNDGKWNSRKGWTTDGTDWFTTYYNPNTLTWRVEKWSGTTFTRIWQGNEEVDYIRTGGITFVNGYLVVLAEFINNEWYVVQVDPATGNYMSYLQWPASHVDGGDLPAIGTMHDPYIFGDERLVIAQSRGSTNKVRVQRYTYVGNGLMPREHTVECNTTHDMGLSGIAGGWLDFTTGDQHFVYSSNGGGSFYVMSEVGIQENNFNWTSEMSTGKVGFIYHDNKWQAMDKNGLMRVYTSINYDVSTTSTDLTKWVSLTYYRSGTAPNYQTTQSSRASITIPKRSQLTVTTPKLLASPGATDPNAVRIYVGKGATDPGRANMVYQGDVGYPVTAATFNALSTTNTDRPPTINDFPGATAAKLVGGTKRADGITPRVNVEGTGVAHIDGLIPPGTIMMWAGVTAPAGWALCDGSTVSRTGATADLAALFWDGTNYRFGNGNGTTTFNLPNFNNKLPIGAGTKALSTTGGSETKIIGTNHLPPHTHGVNRADGTGGNVNNVARGGATNVGDATTGNGAFANDPLNIMPPWLAISFIIKL